MFDKRKKTQDLIELVMSTIDPTLINTKKYRTMFQTMNDQQFTSWMEQFLQNPKSNLRLDIEEFGDGSRVLNFDNVEKAAQKIGIELFEYVYVPHVSSNPDHPIRTKKKVLVGHLNIKRPQQLVAKKTGLTMSDTDRDETSGAAKGDSKGGKSTGIENEMLIGLGGEEIISEILGSRADNAVEYDNMLQTISENGSVRLEDIKTSAYDKPTLLTTDMFFKAMGIKTDIVSPSYYSPGKIKEMIAKSPKK